MACLAKHNHFYSVQYYLIGKREILALAIYCDNQEKGCRWQGTIAKLTDHVAKCEYAIVSCNNKCQDENNQITQMMRKHLPKHLTQRCPCRPYKCEECQELGTHASITQDHYKVCRKKILPCSNTGCSVVMEHEYLKRHLDEECEYAVLPCKYRRLGCDVQLLRKDVRKHESDNQILHRALNTIVELEKKLVDSVTCFEKANLMYSFKMTQFKSRLDNKELVHSPYFNSHPSGYKMKIGIILAGLQSKIDCPHMTVGLIMSAKNIASTPIQGKLTVTLLNQLADEKHHVETTDFEVNDISQCDESGCIMCALLPTFIPHAKLEHDLEANTQYLKEDCLFFRILVQTSDYKPWLNVPLSHQI